MNYIVRCASCGQKSICQIENPANPAEKRCSICGSSGDKVRIEVSVEEVMPSADLIARGMGLGKKLSGF